MSRPDPGEIFWILTPACQDDFFNVKKQYLNTFFSISFEKKEIGLLNWKDYSGRRNTWLKIVARKLNSFHFYLYNKKHDF